jgi:hypothetical protein
VWAWCASQVDAPDTDRADGAAPNAVAEHIAPA